MNIFEEKIIPFCGIGNISFSMSYDDTKDYLKANGIKYTVDLWDNKGCDPEVPWKIIRIDNSISLFFAKDKMFKICLECNYSGLLENGIGIGMPIIKAQEIDSSLVYEEDEEYYCDVQMDEDEFSHVMLSQRKKCPFYRNGDEYEVVKHQAF